MNDLSALRDSVVVSHLTYAQIKSLPRRNRTERRKVALLMRKFQRKFQRLVDRAERAGESSTQADIRP